MCRAAISVRYALKPLAKSHKLQFVDDSNRPTDQTHRCSNPTNGSLWILQVQPTSTRAAWLDSGIPLDGSQWIVQVQPTTEARRYPQNQSNQVAIRCRLDLNDPLTAVRWDSNIIKWRFLCRSDLNNLQTAVWRIFARTL
jgi:hypothetical protein